ncbi:MAG TPA: glycosyltransferase N-terminal domain-containing protein [Gemmatimonadaceae bacterium]
MNGALRVAYEGAARFAGVLSQIAPEGRNKVLDSLAARHGLLDRYDAFARDTARDLLWMHAPSVGEGLQAKPVLDLMRERHPSLQLAYTWFSPSAREFAAGLPVDFQDALPFDSTPSMRRALAALSPRALVFSKLDVWPTLAREAATRGTRLGLISATLARNSTRRNGLAAALLRDAYGWLDRVGAVSAEDADRLVSLGVPASRVTVTGDTRFDQVWARAQRLDREGPLLASLASERPTLVAGSTWPADESVLLAAWQRFARPGEARLIIAPHEPSVSHLDPIDAWAAGAGLRAARLGARDLDAADVVVVDRVGVLGDLYALAEVAFVGGGFHSAGLHSVLEPAAFGAPVLFGPRHAASRDARLLLDDDGAMSVSDADELVSVLETWRTSPAERERAGAAALAVVRHGLGAAERSYALVRELLA